MRVRASAAALLVLSSCRLPSPPAPPAEVEVPRARVDDTDVDHRPLTAAEIDNLVALTRFVAYLRYFHPSDAALVADWDALAVQAASAVERRGSTPAELARTLGDLVHRLAPTVTVHPTGESVAPPPGLYPPDDTGGPAKIVAMRHDGVGTGVSRLFASRRIDDQAGRHAEPGTLTQTLDAAPYRGKRVRVRAWVRAEPKGETAAEGDPAPGALFGLHVALPGGFDGFVDVMEDRPITARAWRTYEVVGDVDDEAETLSVVLRLVGEGRAFIDGVTLDVIDGRRIEPIELANAGFEEGAPGQVPPGWTTRDAPSTTGYRVEVSRERPWGGRGSGAIASVPLPREVLPPPSQVLKADLGAGVTCEVPLSLYYRDGRTLPHTAWPFEWQKRARDPFAFDPKDRATRLASVIELWGALAAFYPYFDEVAVDWPLELRAALSRAAVARDEQASLATLRRLVAALHDGGAAIVLERRDEFGHVVPFELPEYGLPILWDWVEDQLVVTAVRRTSLPKTIRPGDAIMAIDGVPARKAIEATLGEVSAATPQHALRMALKRLANGPLGRGVLLTVKPRTEDAFAVHLEYDLPLTRPRWLSEGRPAPFDAIEPGIAYVDLDRIGEDDFDRAVPTLAAAKGIVFDLRGNPAHVPLAPIRHLVDVPLESPKWCVPRVTRPERQGMSFVCSTWTVAPLLPRFRGKVAFVTDARAASQAETLLAMVDRYKLGEIVGGVTAGSNGTRNTIRLPGGFSATFTGVKVVKHDGSRLHGVGIQPTLPVERTILGVAAGLDEPLHRALLAVGGGAD
jgi:C-terminal processing protease CtpA/Prc